MIACLVLGKENEVVTTHVFLELLVEETALGNVHLAADDGLELLIIVLIGIYLAYIVEELLYTHHVAMVGDGYALHVVGNGLVDKFLYGSLSVEYGVL